MRRLGTIECLEHNIDDNAPWVILFHGYGADASDLSSLVDYVPTQKKYNYLFPNGILEVPIGPGWTGRAWWNINYAEFEKAKTQDKDYSEFTPPGLEKVRDKVFDMIQALKIPWNQIVLGGFSQGSMLASEIYLKAPETPKGLVILSGIGIHLDQWRIDATKRSGQKFFQSHGTNDPILPYKLAQKLETTLTQAGMKGRLLSFNGGHEIPPAIMQQLGIYLNGL